MSTQFDGKVIRGARVSPTNAKSTGEASCGVVRSIEEPTNINTFYSEPLPDFTDAVADQYKVALLNAPGTTPTEYCVWVANTGNLAYVEGWEVTTGTGQVLTGTYPVDTYTDGSRQVFVQDDGNRNISHIISITVIKAEDTDNPRTLLASENSATSTVFTITSSADLLWLDGGLSVQRGDRVTGVTYTLTPLTFWWTRNDRYQTRFGWNGATQRWEPYKGGSPENLGPFLNKTYQVTPKISNFPIGAMLPPSDARFPDVFAVFRIGSSPSATNSIPVGDNSDIGFEGIQVFPDSALETTFDFSAYPTLSGVMSQFTGKVQFNPNFVKLYAGKTLWYYYRNYNANSKGIVGKMAHADYEPLFIAPIPDPMGHPFIRFGSRAYLNPILVNKDAGLYEPVSGSVCVSLTTGQLRFNSDDIAKANPENVSFDKQYLSEDVVYDGVALNANAQPLKEARPIESIIEPYASYYLLESRYLPSNNIMESVGVSGVLNIPDDTGALPTGYVSGSGYWASSVRPGGDIQEVPNTGMVRQINDRVGEPIFFTSKNTFANTHIVDFIEDIPKEEDIATSNIYVSRFSEISDYGSTPYDYNGSVIQLGTEDIKTLEGERLYFRQTILTPAFNYICSNTELPKLYSRNRDIFRFTGTEKVQFILDEFQQIIWSASSLPSGKSFYTADEVAQSIDEELGVWGDCYTQNGYLVIQAKERHSYSPAIEVIQLTGDDELYCFQGMATLGFLPYWIVKRDINLWLPDSGVSFGFFRNPANLDGSLPIPDLQATARIDNQILQNSVAGSPFQFLDQVPLQDIPGYEPGVFFSQTIIAHQEDDVQVIQKHLEQCVDVVYRFAQKKFDWVVKDQLSQTIDKATATLSFNSTGLVPESFYGNVSVSKGLYISADGGPYVFQDPDTDFVLPQGGQTGTAILVEKFGVLVTYGAQGQTIEGSTTFTDNSVNFLDPLKTVSVGYRLDVDSTEIGGSYIVTNVTEHTLEVTPAFTQTLDNLGWTAYTGYPDSVYDPSLVADIIYKEFNHLQTEPFKVRVLSYVGDLPASEVTPQLKANVADAKDRVVNIRYGLVAPTDVNTAQMVALQKIALGTIANDVLIIPDTNSTRFASGSFSIQVGATIFTHASGKLVGVVTFDPDPLDKIEYLVDNAGTLITGTLRFGSQILSEYAASSVLYTEDFQPAIDVPALTVEYDNITGYLNFSQSDMDTFAGTKTYFVIQMLTEGRTDVTISPLLGAFTFSTPVSKGSIVEVQYWQADLKGMKVGSEITEFLPVFVRNERAVKTGPNTYSFNANKYTIDQRIEPIVTIGAVQQNFGHTDFVVDYPADLDGLGRLTFVNATYADYIPVIVNFAVWEALGGERGYESSTKPVYRPPFYITAGQSRFGLRGDRTNEFVAGQLFRIGGDLFYVKKTQYYPYDGTDQSNITAVYIYPPTTNEVGSRAPGNDVITVVSSQAVTTVVDPDNSDPAERIPTNAPAGFMSTIDLSVFPFQPVSNNQKNIVFQGNLTQFAVAGHILEVGGCPFTIASSTLSDDGCYTDISVTAPFQNNFDVADNPTVKLSYRPIYPPQPMKFIGCGSVLESEPVTLTLYSEGIPGRALIPTIEYNLDYQSGNIELLSPIEPPLAPHQKLILSFTRIKMLQPFIQNNALILPRMYSEFLHGIIPDDTNGLLGSTLSGTYTFRNPDTFYACIETMKEYVGEVTQKAVADMQAASNPNSGPVQTNSNPKNWEQGRTGLISQRQDLLNTDRGARRLLDFYNSICTDFEQIIEAITGEVIGDWDGKFKFKVIYGKDFPGPGDENPISGNLVIRNLWNKSFLAANPSIWFNYMLDDILVDPATASIDETGFSPTYKIIGTTTSSDILDNLILKQVPYAQNNIDDLFLISAGLPIVTLDTSGSFPISVPKFNITYKGIYEQMWENNQFSRLFPLVTESFSMTYPGIGAVPPTSVGVYTAGRMIDGKMQSTTGKPIGQLYNPVVENITNVASADLGKRLGRGRIWGYFPDGLPAGAFFDAGPTPSPTIAEPCIIVFPTYLSEVPINPETGYPDQYALISQSSSGTVPDAMAGDPAMSVPGFTTGNQLSWGKPDRNTYFGVTDNAIATKGLFVREVLYGCVIKLNDSDDNLVSSPDNVRVATSDIISIRADEFPIVQGDTLYEVPTTLKALPSPTPATSIVALGKYRNGFDLLVQSNGQIVDTTFPSAADSTAYDLKGMLGQNPPLPMSYYEGDVNFAYEGTNPLLIPALFGGFTNDSGDYGIPYIKSSLSEYDLLAETPTYLLTLLNNVSFFGIPDYPDEIIIEDGTIYDYVSPPVYNPAVLITQQDVLALTHVPASQYDLMFVQVGDPSHFYESGSPIRSPQGIWQIGEVTSASGISYVEIPRFVTQSSPPASPPAPDTGSSIKYTLNNAMSHIDDHTHDTGNPQIDPPLGVKLIYYPNLPTPITILDFSDIPDFSLNNGIVPGVGNLNNIYNADPNNKISIRLYSQWDLAIQHSPYPLAPPPYPWMNPGCDWLMTFDIQGPNVTITDWVMSYPATPVTSVSFGAVSPTVPANDKQIQIPAIFANLWLTASPTNQWYLPYAKYDEGLLTERWEMIYGLDYSFDIDTTAGQSTSGWIGADRLTFHETIDLRHSKKRGYQPYPYAHYGTYFQTELVVEEVTVGYDPSVTVSSTVNKWVNGWSGSNPYPFTFLPRIDAIYPDISVGNWSPRSIADAENGTLKVMSYEGYNNTPITATDAKLTIAASTTARNSVCICNGTGFTESWECNNPDLRVLESNIQNITIDTGAIADVQSGDVLVIQESTNTTHIATTKAGSFIVRYAMEGTLVETDLGKAHEFDISGYVGDDWCPMHFPTVISATVIDPTSVRLEISDLAPAYGGPTIDGHSSGFATSGRLYITWGDYTIGETYNGAYSSIDATGSYPVIIVSDFRNAIGTPQLASTFANMATEIGTLVSGMLYLPLNVSNNTLEQDALLPPNNCVGLHNIDSGIGPTYSYTYGFKQVVLSKEGSYTFDSKYPSTSPSDGIIPFNTITPLTGNLLINAIDINDTYNFSNVYMPDQTTPIYYHTPHTLYIGEMTDAQWQALYAVGGTYTYAKVILPNVLMTANFFAKEGIFLEPSMPRTCLDLTSSVYPLVVDYHHLLPTPDTEDKSNFIGTRCSNYYDPTSTVQSTGEKVTFQIRSIRRFHKTLEETTVFEKLRYLYEIRRGIVTGYSTITDKQKGIVTASNFYMNYSVTYPKPADVWCNGLGPYNGTNLGPFTSSDVNIQAGDMFRLLDDNGNVIEEIEIDSIQDDSTLILTTPGLQTNPIGQRFEIYLRQSPVPHEQSNEQLLSLMTNKVVCTTNANFDTQLGGYVKDTIDYADVNKLYDDLNTETFTSKGVQKDDIVIIDPVGTLEPLGHPYPAQRGMHPIGDRSTSSRLTEYLAGRPSELDDNRGFYRVTKVVNTPETYLEVSPINTFAGLPDEPVVFGTAGDTEYAVYPTINDSLLAPSHKEGQMDLRPTATRVDGSWYNTEGYSIRPFSYKVIRPSKLFTNESIDLILSTRERMLTWIEMLSPVSDRFKLGSYFIFQKDCQIENLNTLTNPEIGLGVPSNDYLWEITGLNQYVPYANNSSSMSILDRRFWIEDTRLDDLTYDSATIIGMKLAGSGDTTYTDFENDSNIKPVLLGRINNVLEKKDKFYDMRYMWVNYRTNKIFGTLPKIKQFDLELPKKLEEQKATALLVATATKVSDEE